MPSGALDCGGVPQTLKNQKFFTERFQGAKRVFEHHARVGRVCTPMLWIDSVAHENRREPPRRFCGAAHAVDSRHGLSVGGEGFQPWQPQGYARSA